MSDGPQITADLIARVKARASGQWRGILSQYIAADTLDGKGHPCPKCGGDDRFNTFDDFDKTGGVNCRHCFNEKNGDGIAAIAWLRGISQADAIKALAEQLGIDNDKPIQFDIIQQVCNDKRMPIDAFKGFGAKDHKSGRGGRQVARLPVYNGKLERCGWFDIWPGDKGRFSRGSESGLFLPHDSSGKPITPKAGETVLITEGCKDAAALIGLGFKAIGLPTSFLDSSYADLFRGVNVVIVPDLDEPAENGQYKTGGHLRGIADSIKVVRLPGELKTSKGDDVRDIIRKKGSEAVKQAIENAKDWEPREGDHDPNDGREEIYVTLNEATVNAQIVRSLGKLGWDSPWIKPESTREKAKIFHRCGSLVSVVDSEDPSAPKGTKSIRALPVALLRERITQACKLVQERETENGIEVNSVSPPKWAVDAIFHRGHWDGQIRPLTGLIQAPTLRPDGTLLQTPGYDKATGLIYHPLADFPKVADKPTREDAQKAAERLLEVIVDVPVKDAADRSAWMAMVLTMIGRQCIEGCVPMFPVDANIRGAGKSLVVDAASLIAYGKPAARRVFTRDDDEQRKLVTTAAIEITPLYLLDNVDQQLGGGPLDAAITSLFWNDRILGSSRTTGDLPLRCIWTATGNNIAYGSDLARRVLPIRLMTQEESPEDRTGFKHPNLLEWVSSKRPELAADALTILRAYFVAGKPVQDGGTWGSFEKWTETVRGAIVWAGFEDPMKTRESAKASDDSREMLGMLVSGLIEVQELEPDQCGFTARDIENFVTPEFDTETRAKRPPRSPALAEAVSMICGPKFDARKFARRIRGFVGRNWRGYAIKSENVHGGIKAYSAITLDVGGSGGCGGTVFPSLAREYVCVQNPHIGSADTAAPEVESRNSDQPQQPQPPAQFGREALI